METLIQKILDGARDEVAQKYGYDNWKDVEKRATSGQENGLLKDSTELAMDRQAEFFRWIGEGGEWEFVGDGWWSNGKENKDATELELYNIWRESTTQQ